MKQFKGLTTIIFLFLVIPCFSQWEFGGGLGPSNYLGEIGGLEEPKGFIGDLQLKKTRMGINAFGRYNFTDKLALSAGIAHGWLEGADSLSLSPNRFTRNLSFRNQIFEFYLRGEVDLFALQVIKRGGRFRLRFAPYLFFGGGVFYHNPKAYYLGDWYSLQTLQTEGVAYKKINYSIPLGMGVSFKIGRHHNFGWEVGWRPTFTDYIDDVSGGYQPRDQFTDPVALALSDRSFEVNPDEPNFLGTELFSSASSVASLSPRGNPETNDSYLMSYFTYSYSIGNVGGRSRGSSSKSRYSLVKPNNKSFRKKSIHKYKRRTKNRRKKKLFHKKLHPHF